MISSDTADPQLPGWVPHAADPDGDRLMLAIQYVTAIVAAFAAALLGLVH